VVAGFGDRTMDDVTRGEIIAWMGKLKGAEGSRSAAGRAARALWKWALHHDPQMVSQDIAANLPMRQTTNQGDAKIFTVDQAELALRTAAQFQSALALLLFAGIRPEEVHGRAKPPLLWSAINMAEHYIRVPADISKTGKPRIVDSLPETLWEWLTPLDGHMPISPSRTHQIIWHCKKTLGADAWSHDVTRHTFASYALAHTADPGKVAHWLGHEGVPSLLHRTYRGLATKVEAGRYFGLKK
jgi:integrase